MANIRSLDFLPEIFRTKTNEQFLGSTLDQLIQEPRIKKKQGYVGRRTGPGITTNDTYVEEPDATRQNYQLEPGIIFKDQDGDPVDALTYPGLIDGIALKGGETRNHDRMFASETYSWSPLVDLDKFINYSQYYWLPEGPDSVDVSASTVFLTNDFEVTRNAQDNVYNIQDFAAENPIITLLRGGSYNFEVSQTGNPLWIQTDPDISGTLPWSPNISSRDILGVSNNGEDNGIIEFNVPEAGAQNFYSSMTDLGGVDLATDRRFNEINRRFLRDLLDINDIQDLQGKTIVFLDDQPGAAEDLGWVIEELSDIADFDDTPFAETEYLETKPERYRIWEINLIPADGDFIVDLIPIQNVNQAEKFTIQYGATYSNVSFFKNAQGYFERVPLLTASLDRLYYRDANNPNMLGIINIVDEDEAAILRIENILGQKTYTSPNGVVFTNGLKVQFRGNVEPEEYQDNEYYVEGVGRSIKLLPVEWFVTPEPFTRNLRIPYDIYPYDVGGYDGSLDAPLDPDYLTINRAAQDRNAWTRSNRWFHKQVIEATAEYNNTVVTLNQDNRAKRPIIEFEPNIQLYNFGNVAKDPINIIDFQQTDALSNVHGSVGYSVDGFALVTGTRIVFASDEDVNVRNKIYEVTLEDLSGDGEEQIVLTEAADAVIDNNASILVKNGLTLKGTSYAYTDNEWVPSQVKTSINQAPLFDIFDDTGESFSEISFYPASTFRGSKLFSYAIGDGTADPILGFPLEFLSIDNLGDIVFDNNMYTDEFVYVQDTLGITKSVADGFVKQYSKGDEFDWRIGWTNSAEIAHVPQIFRYIYNGDPMVMDIVPRNDLEVQATKVFVNSTYLTPDQYTLQTVDSNTLLTIDIAVEDEANIEVVVISEQVSEVAYYQVPDNLTRNVFNENADQFTLGTVRNHYNNLAQNLLDLVGDINGSNNIRDLGEVNRFGNIIVQNSAPLAPTAHFIRTGKYNFFQALKFNGQQYEKYKNQIIDWVAKNDVYDWTPGQILERAIKFLNTGRSPSSAFYNSDMLPHGPDYVVTTHEITAISTDTFISSEVYDFNQANLKGLLVYLNEELLVKDVDYTVADDGPRVTLLIDVEIGDILEFHEYANTQGSYIPATPTKLGLYPKYHPRKELDDTYLTPRETIIGHDGSVTVAFGDIRDDVLLEFEKRVYSNIKVNDNIPLLESDVVPGQFRDTEYTDFEITSALSPMMLSWVGWNRLNYRQQDYRSDNSFTWNYSNSTSKLDDRVLKGHWRAVYDYYYDTGCAHIHPWEMLGLSRKPDWWDTRYGPAPYTSGNLVLWEDIAAGRIADPDNDRIDERYVRPELLDVLPVDGEGNLITPMESIVANYSSYNFKRDWRIGDQGPVETAWRRSSMWPFAVQQLLALTKPARYFAQNIDRDRFTYSDTLGQYVYDGRGRIDVREIEVMSDSVPKHSYINWVVDYTKHFGYNSRDQLVQDLSNMDVNLCYRMAGFTDKNKLKIFTDKSSPDSTSASLLYPDESYNLLLYKNQAYDEVVYSSVIVQRQDDGYVVYGNSVTDPYFKVMRSVTSGRYDTYYVGRTDRSSTKIRVPKDFTDTVVYVPYGYVFSNKHAVVDFLASYGEYLRRAGVQHNQTENGQDLTWVSMTKEFIYWDNQGWATSSVINLNPGAQLIEFEREQMVVDNLLEMSVLEQPQDQNKFVLGPDDFVIERVKNNFKIETLDDRVVSYLNMHLVNYEHLLILDNTSIFNDVMYAPVNGIRQSRINITGFITDEWNGQLDAQGFMFNNERIPAWDFTKSYQKGSVVDFKNSYWVASTHVPESEEFNFNLWIKTNKEDITTGLLANLATKSDQMLQFYNNKTANLESDADLLALGLTGFRERDYLAGLDLDDISQVNIYLDMIRQKGTATSLEMFKGVELFNETTDYDVLENWAVKRAEYGATASRAYIELQLDEELLREDPALVEVSNEFESEADQIVRINDIYKQSEKHTTTDLIPILDNEVTDIALPYAGFVDFTDVDLYTYNARAIDDIDLALDKIIDGSLIWVARDMVPGWNVYRTFRVEPELGRVFDNLNGTLTLEFNGSHNLKKLDIIIIKYHDELLNRAHLVAGVEDQYKIQILGNLEENQNLIDNETGMVFKLTSVRLNHPSDIVDSEFDRQLFADDKLWIDDYEGKSRLYQKENVFEAISYLESDALESDTNFGAGIGQGRNDYGALIGDDNGNAGRGMLYGYTKDGASRYVFTENLKLGGVDNLTDYGKNIQMSESVAIASAQIDGAGAVVLVNRDKKENLFTEDQIITPAATFGLTGDRSSFGDTIELSDDENWLFVAEPEQGAIHRFQLIDYEVQEAKFVGDGATTQFELAEQVVIGTTASAKDQVQITIDSFNSTPTYYDYVIDGTTVQFLVAPPDGSVIIVTRRNDTTIPGAVASTSYFLEELYGIDEDDCVSVYYDEEIVIPGTDFTFNSVGKELILHKDPTGVTVRVKLNRFYRYNNTFIPPAGADTVGFGTAMASSEDGEHLIIGNPFATVNGLIEAGEAYVYERIIERTVVQVDGQTQFVPQRGLDANSIVRYNGRELTSSRFNAIPEYRITGGTVELLTITPVIGDYIDIGTGHPITYVQTLTSQDPEYKEKFGASVAICRSECSVFVGAPGTSNVRREDGSVTRFTNDARMNNVVIGDNQNPSGWNVGDTIRVNHIEVAMTNVSVEQAAQDITDALTPNVRASVDDGYLVIELKNRDVKSLANRLTVMPGFGGAYNLLGLKPYTFDQLIIPPETQDYGHFGSAVEVDYNMNQIYVGADNQTARKLVSFDGRTTTFDGRTMRVIDDYYRNDGNNNYRSGVIYTYDLLPDAVEDSAGKFAYGEQIYDYTLKGYDGFASSINVVDGLMLVGSPGYDGDIRDEGRVVLFYNETGNNTWTVVKEEQPNTDVSMINAVYLYDKDTNQVIQHMDYIDPLNGKILGAAQQNIDYIRFNDPAQYSSSASGPLWGAKQVGKIWWATDTVKFLDYFQDDIKQASKRWGKAFPGSFINVYQWIESDNPPLEYTGEGTPYDTDAFIALSAISETSFIETKYYFWVKNLTQILPNSNKTLSTSAISEYIENPAASGIPFVAFIKPNVYGLYNVRDSIDEESTILHIEYDKIKNDNNVFVEFELIREGDANDMLEDELYRKMLDSFCGADTLGNNVPDINLAPTDQYGVSFRPRQSMFVDRFAALSSYIQRVNSVLIQWPVAESKIYPLLEDEEAPPAANTGAWDEQVADNAELSYQDLALVPTGHRYLVNVDSTNAGRWAIYEVTENDTLLVVNVQAYDTKQFWSFADWYAADFEVGSQVDVTVETQSELDTVPASENMLAKVNKNSIDKWELYKYTSGEWNRVGLQDGSIQFNAEIYDYSLGRYGYDNEVFDAQFFDQEPIVETRNILRSINEELLVDDLALERNAALISVFKYILAEQGTVEWLTKTSLIDVNHKVRSLAAYPIYQKESQDLVLDFINESKPYHTKIKDFRLTYDAMDVWEGNVTDFDCPAYYDIEFEQFVSPVLDDGALLVTSPSNRLPNDEIWQTTPWNDWYDNHRLTIDSVEVINGGTGYYTAPQVIVTGESIAPAQLRARISGTGEISEIIVDDPGKGYRTTPIISFEGGNGSGATARAVVQNDLVRTFETTIKFDRYEYDSAVLPWEDTETRNVDDLVRFNNMVFRVTEANSDLTFIASKYEEVSIEELSGVDRTQGFYIPDVNKPGLDLALLIDGIDFPGVQVDGVSFDSSSGFDVELFDSDFFDGVNIGPDGLPTYSEALLDADYESAYTDSYLGTRPTDINVDGASYVDEYHSHAPEELVPGSTFDTLDMTIFTRPGSDYLNDGHGFKVGTLVTTMTENNQIISFDGVTEYPIGIIVVNATTNTRLYENVDYFVHWYGLEFQLQFGAVVGDKIKVYAYEIGGGDQLLRRILLGNEVVDNKYQIPVAYDEIDHLVIFANGVRLQNFTTTAVDAFTTEVEFSTNFDEDEFITITALGVNGNNESYWETITFVAGSTNETLFNQAFFNQDFYSGGFVQPLDEFLLPEPKLVGRNEMNAIVEINGKRLRPPEARRYFGNDSTVAFNLPTDGDIDQASIAANEVFVYVNNEKKELGIDYTVSAIGDLTLFGTAVFGNDFFFDPDEVPSRYITFNTAPVTGDIIDIYCNTDADYHFNSTGGGASELVLRNHAVIVDDVVAVTVYGDTSELGVFTEVFRGPTTVEEILIDTFDQALFDEVEFDQLLGQNVAVNIFGIDQLELENPERLWVTLNGNKLNANDDYFITDDNRLVVTGPVLDPTDILAVTTMTKNVVSNGISYKYFKDMRDNSAMYAVGSNLETFLTSELRPEHDIIYVNDVTKLGTPNLANNEFGIVIINGERITYREINVGDNTLLGIRRGTAGTGMAAYHPLQSTVRDVSKSSMVPNTFNHGSFDTFVSEIYGQPDTIIPAAEMMVGGRYIVETVGPSEGANFASMGLTPDPETGYIGIEFTAPFDGYGDGTVRTVGGWDSAAYYLRVEDVTDLVDETGYGRIYFEGIEGWHGEVYQVDFETNTINGVNFVQNDGFGYPGGTPITPDPVPAIIPASTKIYKLTKDTIWYAQGTTTASNGVPLNEQETVPVLFVKDRA